MKKKKEQIIDLLKDSALIFTFIILLLYTLGTIISKGSARFIPTISTVWLTFMMSLLLSLANRLLKIRAIHPLLRVLIHLVACFAVYFVTVLLSGNYLDDGKSTVVAVFVFAVIYILCLPYIVYKLKVNKKKTADKEKYNPKFR